MPDPLDEWHLGTEDSLQMGTEGDTFEPLSYEEYLGEYRPLDSFGQEWRPLAAVACEAKFRAILGGEPPGEGWYYRTEKHFKHFRIAEVALRGMGAVIAPIAGSDDDEILVRFFDREIPISIFEIFEDPKAISEIEYFRAISRALVAGSLNMALAEGTIILAGRFGSPVASPQMIHRDQLRYLKVTDWILGTAQFTTGEAIYSIHAAYSDVLNAKANERPASEGASLRARKAKAIRAFLSDAYPKGVPPGISNGALTARAIEHLKHAGFDEGVSDKTVYRVRREFNERQLKGTASDK